MFGLTGAAYFGVGLCALAICDPGWRSKDAKFIHSYHARTNYPKSDSGITSKKEQTVRVVPAFPALQKTVIIWLFGYLAWIQKLCVHLDFLFVFVSLMPSASHSYNLLYRRCCRCFICWCKINKKWTILGIGICQKRQLAKRACCVFYTTWLMALSSSRQPM